MTERKWTSGPWVVNDVSVRAKNGSLVSLVYANGEGAMNDNAHLIAAAPDLYEALAVIVSFGVDEASLDTAYDALAKARGEQ